MGWIGWVFCVAVATALSSDASAKGGVGQKPPHTGHDLTHELTRETGKKVRSVSGLPAT